VYQAPRGTQDILPHDQAYWRFVEEKAEKICQLYGYKRIDTPVFEQTSLFRRSVGEGTDIVEKQMYTFEDQGGDSMTLRPEGTAPVCRAYIEHGMHNLPQPVRLYYIGPIFRYERPQAGRYRQHRQFGVEAIGDADPALDAEVVGMAWYFYASLGLKGLTLQLNSIGCQVCRPDYLEKLRQYYSGHAQALCPDCRRRLQQNPLRLLDCKKPSCQEIVKGAPEIAEHLCPQCASHFDALKGYLEGLQIPYELNPYLVRGLDYYTRTVFEIQPQEGGAQSALGGGGRYDGLIEQLGGTPAPAIGFATGLERIILNLHHQGINLPPIPGPAVYIAYLGEDAKKEAIRLAAKLRQAGIGATIALGDKSLKSRLKQANSLALPQTLIIGDDELKKGVAVLRDMAMGEQVEVPLQQVVARLKKEA
jgi:histidyl-tRNA synthetase